MKKTSTKFLAAFAFIYPLLCGPVFADGPLQSGALSLLADSLTYDKSSDSYTAEGDVKLEWDDATLTADSALLRQADSTAEAQGSVLLRRGGDTLHAQRLTLNLDTERGAITDGYLFMQQGNFHLRGTKMEKLGVEDYHIENGSFTVCDGDVPSWKFTAKELDVTLGEYATGKNVLFYIKDVPVLYLPYMVFPIKRERQSGLLIPRLGTSGKKGLNLVVPYYWVISPNQDAIFSLDISSRRGVGTGFDYRYIRKAGSEGSFRGYMIYDTDRDRIRGDFSEKHVEEISPSITFKSDVNYTSDRDFYRDYTDGFGEYNRKSVDSNIFLTKRWQGFSLTPELRFSQDLDSPTNTATLQKLPLITLTGVKQRIGSLPVYFSLDSNFTNFYREEGLNGQRIDVHPSLWYYFNPVRELEGVAWFGYRERLYNTYGGGSDTSFRQTGLFDGGVSFSSTLARVYDIGGSKLSKVQNILIPEIAYTYQQNVNQESLPFFDFNDRAISQNKITYSLASYLTGKFANGEAPADYRNLAYLKLSQEYDFGGTRRDLLTLYDELHPFSDVRIEAAISPFKGISFTTDSRFNPYHTNFSTTNVAVKTADDKGNLVEIGYRFSRTQLEYLEGKLLINLLKPFVFQFDGRYSVDGGALLESYYSLEYKQQCWSVAFSYGNRPGNTAYYVNFTIAGVGALGKMKLF
jgi:LPS-assembly protein